MPREVRLEFDRERNRGVLHWSPGPMGRKPVAYRVHASDEKGFSVSDRPYEVTVGAAGKMPSEFPANFVVETSASELEVVGPHAKLPGLNKAFYRVVAVDAAGNRSGPSDYAAAPAAGHRQRAGDRGQQRGGLSLSARGHPIAGRSQDPGDRRQGDDGLLGRRTAQVRDPARTAMADDRRGDRPLSGTPDRAGTAEVVVTATLERDARRLDEAALKWGVEKVVSSGTEAAGRASQRFVVDVRP